MSLRMPLWKLVQEPILPIRHTWQDALPILLLFGLLAAAGYCAFQLNGKSRNIARRSLQVISAFIFVVFLHRCLCALRGWAFGLQLIGTNNLIAFGHLSVFVVILGFAALYGRLFCGWLCPISLPQELLGKLARIRQRIDDRKLRIGLGVTLLVGLAASLVWLALAVRPATRFFAENVAALWGGALLIILAIVLLLDGNDRRLRSLKYFSVAGWLGLSVLGVFVTNPWCVLMGDEIDYSSLVSLLAVVSGTILISMAWCRYLCPMGGCLALAAKFARFGINNSERCDGCGQCSEVCPTDAIFNGAVNQSDCIYCAECVGICGFHWHDSMMDADITPATGQIPDGDTS